MTDHAAEPTAAAPEETTGEAPPDFEVAVDREVAARVDAIERRWQSKKDREVHRERLRSQTATATLDDEVSAWVEEADPADVGRWLKDKLGASPDDPPPATTDAASPDEYVEGPADAQAQAAARQQLAEARAAEPSPDLAPSMAAPVDAFESIEARFARGEIGLDAYEAARREASGGSRRGVWLKDIVGSHRACCFAEEELACRRSGPRASVCRRRGGAGRTRRPPRGDI